jgi:glycine hydroxymethyltransferase
MTTRDFLFRGSLREIDPDVADLIAFESERQARKLILVASESSAPQAVLEALGSRFQNLYAEGYPNPETRWLTEEEILDYERQLAHYRRYGDPRYYRGVEYVDIAEALARRRCAEAFATPQVPADRLYVNVQPLSGAPANNAVYEAVCKPGDTVMGLSLVHGGHLTHGSPVNRSGKHYNIVSYEVDPVTERLDYDQIQALAEQYRPRMIIAGYTSYPWMPDWARFRQIADSVGAVLLADIAHTAGLVAAGVAPSPVGYADVITFTTHKTLCGPRGACILTTKEDLAYKIDRAVFPGEQGGPHAHVFVALAVTFKLARTEPFRALMAQIVRNARHLAACLAANGLRIPYGGTDTHLLVVDCKSVKGPDGTPLMGDIAARILDLAGIVVNRNTIPGDKGAGQASGLRLGTPWVTQRGLKEPEIERLAGLIARLLQACQPFVYAGTGGDTFRAKVDFEVLESVKLEVAEMAAAAGLDFEPRRSGYPHFWFITPPERAGEGLTTLELEGERAREFLHYATTNDVYSLRPGQAQPTFVGDRDGALTPAVLVRPGAEKTRFLLTVPAAQAPRAAAWLRALSDGYVDFGGDVYAKLPGPVIVRETEGDERWTTDRPSFALPQAASADTVRMEKPFFIGQVAQTLAPGPELGPFTWSEPAEAPLKRTPLYETHRRLGAKMVPFAGWEMPVWYTSVSEEHRAVRTTAGLFDVAHMGVLEVSGPNAAAFLDTVTTNEIGALKPGQSAYSYLLDPDGHVIDDLIIYQIEPERYMLVVNAANNDKDWAWLNAVNAHQVRISRSRPWVRAPQAMLRDLRDPASGEDRRVDLALQGPNALKILQALADDGAVRKQLAALKRTELARLNLGGFDLIVSRTGYTGEPLSFELFVHPERAVELWQRLLEIGEAFGLKPVGLGARDSTRTEAGLPLYGHELAGPLGISPGGAGFGNFVKLWKPFFVGRRAYIESERTRTMEVVRFRMNEKGVRLPKLGDPVINRKGQVIGAVTSCAIDTEGYLLGQAYIDRRYMAEGTPIGILSGGGAAKPSAELKVGDRVPVPSEATVVKRFPRR